MATPSADKAQPEAAHAQPVDPGTTPAAQVPAEPEHLHEVQHEMKDMQERLKELERQVQAAPAPIPGVVSDPDRSAPTGDLQAILPLIKDLAQKVGGLKRLAQIINTLDESKA